MCSSGQEANGTLGCIAQSVASRAREVLSALPGKSVSVALHLVLGSPVADRQGTAGESPVKGCRDGGSPEHLLVGNAENRGTACLEKRRLRGT